jgi:hypothetical protein
MFKVQQPEVMKLLTREARNWLLDADYGNSFTLYSTVKKQILFRWEYAKDNFHQRNPRKTLSTKTLIKPTMKK